MTIILRLKVMHVKGFIIIFLTFSLFYHYFNKNYFPLSLYPVGAYALGNTHTDHILITKQWPSIPPTLSTFT